MGFEEGAVREIAEGVWVREAVDNCTWALLDDFVVAVDALEEAHLADEVLAAIETTTGKPLRYLINTHWHGDHTACNRAFAEAGATVIAHKTAAASAKRDKDGYPDVSFDASLTVHGGSRRAVVHHAGGTHTPGDTVVHFEWAGVLCVGDLFGWGLVPLSRIADDAVRRILDIMEQLVALEPKIVVPGHGPRATTAQLERWVEYFRWLLEEVPRLGAAGNSVSQIQEALPMPDDMRDWWRFDWKHPHNIEQIARQAR
ncbi:MAG: MBL fold metallo-hydrolase [Armatimonadota bacterium]